MNQQRLYSACERGDLKEIQQLHACGAAMDVTRPRDDGWTPMLIACFYGHFEIVKWLHAHGGAAMDATWMSRDQTTTDQLQCTARVMKVISRLSNGSMCTVLPWTSRDHVTME